MSNLELFYLFWLPLHSRFRIWRSPTLPTWTICPYKLRNARVRGPSSCWFRSSYGTYFSLHKLIITSMDAFDFGAVASAQGVEAGELIVICFRQEVLITKIYSSGKRMCWKHSMDSMSLLQMTSVVIWLKSMWQIALKICGSSLNPTERVSKLHSVMLGQTVYISSSAHCPLWIPTLLESNTFIKLDCGLNWFDLKVTLETSFVFLSSAFLFWAGFSGSIVAFNLIISIVGRCISSWLVGIKSTC